MALTSTQQASRLFKKSQGVGETLVAKEFFSETILGKDTVYPDQIWSQADQIPSTAPSLVNGASAGVVQYFEKLSLTHVPGSQNLSYQSDVLRDAIPFNLFNGPYNYALYKSDGSTQIPFGSPGGDWLVDTSAGLLTWYGTLPSSVTEDQPPKISFYKYIGTKGLGSGSGLGSITGVTAGDGLTGGGTQGSITLSINPNLAGTGLTYSSGILSITTSQFTSELAGAGLVSNGSQLDVNVDISGLTVSGDMVRLQDTITGDRRFQDSVRIDGNLTVYGTTSYINTENILVEDNILTLNATYSGPYNTLNTGIEANLGGGTYAALIWDYTNSLWSAGFSGSVSSIITEAGTGLTKSGNSLSLETTSVTPTTYGSSTEIPSIIVDQYGRITGASTYSISIPSQFEFGTGLTANGLTVSVDFESITGTGLTQNGSQISVDTDGLAITLSGAGLTQNGGTISVNVENGLSIDSNSNKIVLGGDLTKNTIISGTGFGFTMSVDNIILTNGTSSTIAVGPAFSAISYDYNGDSHSISANSNGISIQALGGINGMNLESDKDLNITATSSLITINNDEGLVYSATPSNAVPLTLIHKEYVDNQIGGLADVDNLSIILNNSNQIQISPTAAGQGLTFSEITGIIDVIWGGTGSGLTFSTTDDSLGVNVDGTTIQINGNGQLTVVAGASTPVYQLVAGTTSTGDNFPTGITLSYTPNSYSRIEVYVNGQKQRLGDGVTQSVDCYFDTTGKQLINLTTGDQLYWNGLFTGYELSTTDSVEIVYEK